MIKAVIFDLDGVLIDSMEQHCKTELQPLHEMGVPATMEELHEFIGVPAGDFFKAMLKKYGKKGDPEKLLERKYALMEFGAEKIPAFPGAIELVESLKSSGFLIAVGSSSRTFFVEKALAAIGLKEKIPVIASSSEVKQGKPAPDIFLLAAKKLSLEPKECVVIEDAIQGVNAAKAAGMKCIAVTNSFPAEKLKAAGAELVVKSLKQLSPKIIMGLGER
ncbi:MAG: HAD family phosphatase [Candidatus Diapherotrites archaeon]